MANEKKVERVLGGQAAQIWADIKDLDLGLYALPNQFVEAHAKPLPISEEKLYLKLASSAVLTALEDAIRSNKKTRTKYAVEMTDKYTVVVAVPPELE